MGKDLNGRYLGFIQLKFPATEKKIKLEDNSIFISTTKSKTVFMLPRLEVKLLIKWSILREQNNCSKMATNLGLRFGLGMRFKNMLIL